MADRTIRNTAVLVLGMGRSGTSSVAGVLQRFGVDLGSNLLPPNYGNAKGYFEHKEVVELHDELLTMLGTTWDDPCSLPSGWKRDPRLGPYRKQLVDIIVRDFAGSQLWGLKDPRMCRLLPLWLDIFDELSINAKAVLVVRHPAEVSASLYKRDRMGFEHSTMLWLSYVLNSELYSRLLPRTVLIYDDLLSNWKFEVQRLRDTLDIDLFAFSREIVEDVSSFLDGDLNHHRDAVIPALRAPQNTCAKTLFESMVAWRREATSPLDVCAQAADDLAYAERAAGAIVSYVRFKAQLEFDSRLNSQSQANLDALRQLEAQLLFEAQAHSEYKDRASEYATLETQLRAECQANLAARLRADDHARVQAQLHSEAVANFAAETLRSQTQMQELQDELRDIQRSRSWRVTRPVRIAVMYLRNLLNRGKSR